MDLIICSRRRYNRFYSFDKKELSISLNLNKNLIAFKIHIRISKLKKMEISSSLKSGFHIIHSVRFFLKGRSVLRFLMYQEMNLLLYRHVIAIPQRILDFRMYMGSYTLSSVIWIYLTSYFSKKYPIFLYFKSL